MTVLEKIKLKLRVRKKTSQQYAIQELFFYIIKNWKTKE
uniref:Uncharacterized protein n=1 Tax=viral metagenome TaxID=1070528 RepID=A0A6C0IP34_9ZZZZ